MFLKTQEATRWLIKNLSASISLISVPCCPLSYIDSGQQGI